MVMARAHHPISRTDHAVLRFAPSPNGLLHLGHALSALENAAMAERLGGRLLLRIEDIDQTRCRPEFEAAIRDDLDWLGVGYALPVRRQSDHLAVYGEALARLDAMGLIFASFESRAELKAIVAAQEASSGRPWPTDPDGAPLYGGLGAAMAADEREALQAEGKPFALRLRMGEAIRRAGRRLTWTEVDEAGRVRETIEAFPEHWGDVVLARKETPTSYHLSVVVDDALQEVSHVVRGKDLYEATAVHRLLQELLGLPEPVYRHHRLILGADGRKLAKSEAATGIQALRAAGASAADIRRLVGFSA
jgi:glutamyl-Q tRNA(Asp) synthetase